jgi:hypothetical protein
MDSSSRPASLDDVKRFYAERLTASSFAVADLGLMTLNPATARMLGIAKGDPAGRPSLVSHWSPALASSSCSNPPLHPAIHIVAGRRPAAMLCA